MSDLKALDIMTRNVILLEPEIPVNKVADIFLKNNINGAPVVDKDQNIIGIITDSDLVMQDVKLHFPTAIQLLTGTILLGSEKKFEEKFRRAVGAKAADVMTKNVLVVHPNDSIEDVATLMTEKEVGRVPVVEDGKVVGIITKKDIVKTIARGI